MWGTYLGYHGPGSPPEKEELRLGIKTVDHSYPCGDLIKDIPGRECKGPRVGASLVGLKDRKKGRVTEPCE